MWIYLNIFFIKKYIYEKHVMISTVVLSSSLSPCRFFLLNLKTFHFHILVVSKVCSIFVSSIFNIIIKLYYIEPWLFSFFDLFLILFFGLYYTLLCVCVCVCVCACVCGEKNLNFKQLTNSVDKTKCSIIFLFFFRFLFFFVYRLLHSFKTLFLK